MNLEQLTKAFNFESSRCLWLIEDINADVLFFNFPYKYINDISSVQMYDLFADDAEKGYKCVLTKQIAKEYMPFLTNSNRKHWNKNLLIKADATYLNQAKACKEDVVISFEKITKSQLMTLFEFVINFNNVALGLDEWNFIKQKINNLQELYLCILLKETNIELKEWPYFVFPTEVNWYAKFKNGTLLEEGLINDKIIPVLKYMIRATGGSSKHNVVRCGIMQFLDTAIKDGQKVYKLNNLWKQLC